MISLDEMLALKALLWPDVTFYDKQVEIIDSWCNVRETVVAAGTEEGKDFVAGFLSVATPLICEAKGLTFKLLTLSVAEDHLKVLWGEIGRFLATSKRPLIAQQGGPLVVNHMELRLASEAEIKNPFNYVRGMVYERPEKLQGHYADFNGVIGDEASGLENDAYTAVQPMKKFLWIGNTNPCQNFYREAIREGDVYVNGRLARKVIRVTAWDSPNVKLAEAEIAQGKQPSNRIVTPGVITWDRLQTYLRIWPADVQDIKLKAIFPAGAGVLLFPEDWLDHCHEVYERIKGAKRQAKAMGVDTAEGGNMTSWAIGDDLGVLEVFSKRTRDTNEIPDITIGLQRRWNVPPDKIVFDLGGSGRVHADRLRRMAGFRCQTVTFGVPPQLDLKRGMTRIEERQEHRALRQSYADNRAMMYDALSQRCNPNEGGYGIPHPRHGEQYQRLRSYLAPIPKQWDQHGEGKICLPSKDELKRLYYKGESPDEADALVLMNYGMSHKSLRAVAGAVG